MFHFNRFKIVQKLYDLRSINSLIAARCHQQMRFTNYRRKSYFLEEGKTLADFSFQKVCVHESQFKISHLDGHSVC